jgi:hypothetical protein
MADIAENLRNGFAKVITGPAKAAADAVDSVRGALGMDPVRTNKIDTSWHNKAVSDANDTFKAKDAADKAAASASKPKATPQSGGSKKAPSYKKGTDYVPETGPAKLHKGEAVLKKEDADKYRAGAAMAHGMGSLSDELGGKEAKPKKEIKHIVTKKAKSGGYIHEHHHTHPEHHPMEEHVSKDQDGMVSHMLENMGEPNPGETEADGGQSGIPAGAAEAAPAGAPAAAPAPTPAM